MDRRRALNVGLGATVLVLVVVIAVQSGLVSVPGVERHESACAFAGGGDGQYDRARVAVYDGPGGGASAGTGAPNGSTGDGTGGETDPIATVEVRVSDTPEERCVGLSATDRLENGSGMLFVHDRDRSLTYVMRGMDFPLDMVFVADNRTVTGVRSAPAPGPGEDGESITRSGYGRYVLEVPRGFADRVGIDRGDRIEVEYLE